MITIAFLLLLLFNAWIVFIYWVTVYRKEGPASPLAIVLLFYLFNYPLRAIMLFVAAGTDLEWDFGSWEWGFSQGEICVALSYATLFAGCLVMAYLMLSRRTKAEPNYCKRKSQPSGLDTDWRKIAFFGLFGAYMLLFVYKAVSSDLFGLYETLEDLKHSFLFNLMHLAADLKWFLVAYAFLRIQRTKSMPVIILAVSVTATIVISAFVSTAKGDLVALPLLWAICVWLVRDRLPKLTMAFAVVAIIGFAFYSYTARKYDYLGVRSVEGGSMLESVRRTAGTVAHMHKENKDLWKEQAGKVFSRFDGMDSLTLCQRSDLFIEKGLYVAGSIVELGNVVPRLVWPTRPHLSFNHHATYAVWGRSNYYFLEMPIGRIGESFYVLNWGGLVYAVFYALLWKWMYRTFMLRSRNDLETAFYLCMVFLVVLPDAYLVYNWKRLVVVAAAYVFVTSNGVMRVRKKTPRVRCQAILAKSGVEEEHA